MANDKLIEIEDLTKVFYTDEVETHALSGIHLTMLAGRVRGHVRTFGLRQIHAALPFSACSIRPPAASTCSTASLLKTLSFGDRSRIRNQEIGFIFQSFKSHRRPHR